jgi:hypothetical protein
MCENRENEIEKREEKKKRKIRKSNLLVHVSPWNEEDIEINLTIS